jgi:hypothetical protein
MPKVKAGCFLGDEHGGSLTKADLCYGVNKKKDQPWLILLGTLGYKRVKYCVKELRAKA